jgi:hypothetical protein
VSKEIRPVDPKVDPKSDLKSRMAAFTRARSTSPQGVEPTALGPEVDSPGDPQATSPPSGAAALETSGRTPKAPAAAPEVSETKPQGEVPEPGGERVHRGRRGYGSDASAPSRRTGPSADRPRLSSGDGSVPGASHSVRLSCDVPVDVLDAARDAVVALSPTGLTLAALVASAVEAEVKRLQQSFNGGRPFPARSRRELTRGRRIR